MNCIKCGAVVSDVITFEISEYPNPICLCGKCKKALIAECRNCGKLMRRGSGNSVGGKTICKECYDRLYFLCQICGKIKKKTNSKPVMSHNEIICKECYDSTKTKCYLCDKPELKHWMIETNLEVDGIASVSYFCRDCWDENFFNCNMCGNPTLIEEMVHDQTNGDLCKSCHEIQQYRELENKLIRRYDYKPRPRFVKTKNESKSSNNIYYGFEVEIDGMSQKQKVDLAKLVYEKYGRFMYIKHDGSLESGYEIVSEPATFNAHYNKIVWPEVLSLASHYGKSHNAKTCGLHVHISKKPLSKSDVYKITQFFDRYWIKIVKLSRRDPARMERWAKRYIVKKRSRYISKSKHERQVHDAGHYFALNLQPKETIEVRIFRGTLRVESFFACLDFVDAMVMYCQTTSIQGIQSKPWSEFQSYVKENKKKYNFLPDYFEYIDAREERKKILIDPEEMETTTASDLAPTAHELHLKTMEAARRDMVSSADPVIF